MQQEYGKAVVYDKTHPRHLAELSRYLRMEYGPGTEPYYLLAELADGARRPRKRGKRASKGVLNALLKAVRALLPNNGRKPKAGTPGPTR